MTHQQLREWLQERLENCQIIAETKSGKDRAGWIEDAEYFAAALALSAAAAKKEADSYVRDGERYRWLLAALDNETIPGSLHEALQAGPEATNLYIDQAMLASAPEMGA